MQRTSLTPTFTAKSALPAFEAHPQCESIRVTVTSMTQQPVPACFHYLYPRFRSSCTPSILALERGVSRAGMGISADFHTFNMRGSRLHRIRF